MPRLIEHLKINHWLGTANWIVSLRWYNYGWKMRDATGSTYKQTEYPNGFKVWYKKPTTEDMQSGRDLTPWPAPPTNPKIKDRDQSAPGKNRTRDPLHLKRLTTYIWCDTHGGVHERKSDPYQDETFCKPPEWRPLFLHARASEGEF